jgi:hypothetical protein
MKPHLLLFLFLAACAGTTRPPALLSSAMENSDLAAEAFAEGRHQDALTAYTAALDAHRQVDNPSGILRNLLNLSIVSDAAGNSRQSHLYLTSFDRYAATLAGSSPRDLGKKETRVLLAEAAAFRARLALDENKPDLAASELARTADAPPEVRGRIANLHARLAERNGEFPAMLRHAKSGVAANRRVKDEAELADSHRLAARAQLAASRPAEAETHFLQALELDRKLARPNCVQADLLGLAGAADLAGDPAKALLFRQRAAAAR